MHAARMHIRAPCPFRGWAGAVQTEGQTCFSSGCAVVPHGPCTLGKGREMFQPLYEVAPCVCVPCSRCGDVHKRSRTITGHIYGYLWRSRCIFSLRSGRGRVWGFGGGIGSRGDSASQVATLSPHVFPWPCTSTGLSSNRASDPLSLKLAQTPADSLHAGMLAGCGGVHGIGGTRRVAGEAGMDFDFLFWSSACRPCRTPHAVHATQPVVACAVRHAPLRFGGACTPSRTLSTLLDVTIAGWLPRPGAGTRLPSGLRPQSPTMPILPCNTQHVRHDMVTRSARWYVIMYVMCYTKSHSHEVTRNYSSS